MSKTMLTVRVEPGLLAWIDGYAQARRVPRSAVVCWALREAQGLAEAGLPDLGAEGGRDGRSASVGRVRGAGSRASSSPGAPAASRPAAGAPAEAVPGWEGRRAANRATEPGAGHPAPPADLSDVVTGTGPRPSVRAVPEAVRARQERLNRAKEKR